MEVTHLKVATMGWKVKDRCRDINARRKHTRPIWGSGQVLGDSSVFTMAYAERVGEHSLLR